MPAPAVYFVAVVATVAAGVAFHQFVYEPHIAPKIEVWAENFLANRAERRRRRQGVSVSARSTTDVDEPRASRGPGSVTPSSSMRKREPDSSSTYELEDLISREVDEWRTEVQRSQGASLRNRKTGGNANYDPMSPTHVVFDSSCPPTPSTARSAHLRASPSQSHRLPTPDPSIVAPGSPALSMNRSIPPTHTNANATSPIVTSDLELLSHRSASPFSVVYASSSGSEDDRPLATSMTAAGTTAPVNLDAHPLMNTQTTPGGSTSSHVRPPAANTNHSDGLISELEFLSSSSEAGASSPARRTHALGGDPFLSDSDSDDALSSVSSRDDFDVGSVSSWASARAASTSARS